MALSLGSTIALLIIMSLVGVAGYFAYMRWRRNRQRKQLLAWAGRSMTYAPPPAAAFGEASSGSAGSALRAPEPLSAVDGGSAHAQKNDAGVAPLLTACAAAAPAPRAAAFVGELSVFRSQRGFVVSYPPSWPAVVGGETNPVAVSFTAPEHESEYMVLRVLGASRFLCLRACLVRRASCACARA